MACPDVSRCDYACLRRGVCDHQGVWKAGMDWAATLAICAFDDRCRMRSQNLDWDEGFHAGTQAAAKAIRAVLTASPAGDDPKALDVAARSSSTEAIEQEVERSEIEADAACLRGFIATYGMTPTMAVARAKSDERKRCAGIAERWLSSPEGGEVYIARQIVDAILSRPSPVPASCKPEGEASLPGKEEGRG